MNSRAIHVGIVLWPKPQDLKKSAGCISSGPVPSTLHPMVCVERNETHGLWIMMSSKKRSLDGRGRRPIPSQWKVGNQNWARKPSYVGEIAIIVPHETMEHASELNESGYWLTQDGAERLRDENQRSGGLTLDKLYDQMSDSSSAGESVDSIRAEIERFALFRGVRILSMTLDG